MCLLNYCLVFLEPVMLVRWAIWAKMATVAVVTVEASRVRVVRLLNL
jgi:hypothetical protein